MQKVKIFFGQQDSSEEQINNFIERNPNIIVESISVTNNISFLYTILLYSYK